MDQIAEALSELAVAFEHLSVALRQTFEQSEAPYPPKEDPEILMAQIKEMIRPNVKQHGKKIKTLLTAFKADVPSDIPANRLKEFKERLQGLVGGQG